MYTVLKQEGRAKRARMETVHGTIETPVFMNVGTAAAIKGAVSTDDLRQIGTQVELSNTYHLHVRPGDRLIKELGGLHILVNNAGITRDNLAMMLKEEDFDAVIETNLKGTFLCMKAVSRIMMKQRYGRIVNLSSVVGLRGNAGQVNYAASKAGVVGMTKSLAKELASRGVTVNAVAPGFIETDMTAAMPQAAKDAMMPTIPMQRLGKPEDVARAVAFLASDEAAYVTGQVLAVDGGMAM